MVGAMHETFSEKFLLQEPLSYKTGWWGTQMTNSWRLQVASGFYAHTLISLILVLHMKAHASCLLSVLRNTVKFRSPPYVVS